MKMLKKEKLKERLKQAIDKHELGQGTSIKAPKHGNIDKIKEEQKNEKESEHFPKASSSSKDTERIQTKPGNRMKTYDRSRTEDSNSKPVWNTDRHQKLFR
jgi:hypothetical protein